MTFSPTGDSAGEDSGVGDDDDDENAEDEDADMDPSDLPLMLLASGSPGDLDASLVGLDRTSI